MVIPPAHVLKESLVLLAGHFRLVHPETGNHDLVLGLVVVTFTIQATHRELIGWDPDHN